MRPASCSPLTRPIAGLPARTRSWATVSTASSPPAQRAGAVAQYQRFFADPATVAHYQAVVWRADGQERVVEAQITFLHAAGQRVAMLSTLHDMTARAQAEDALRASEARQAFLLQLSDALRPLTNPAEIQYQAACTLGAHLGANRVGYAEDGGDGQTFVVTRTYTDGVPGIEGHYRYADVGSTLLPDVLDGRTMVRNDIANDETLTAAEKAAHAALQLGATVNVPLLKAGHLVAVLFVQYQAAHAWSADELVLLGETAERVWAAVERARADAALRESQRRLHMALDAAGLGTFVWYPADDRCQADARMLALFGLPADGMLSLATALATLIHPADRARYAQAAARATDPTGSGRLREDIRVLRPDGTERWLAITGHVERDAATPGQAGHMVGMASDITDRKRADAALRESEAWLRVLVESVQDYAIFTLDPHGRVTSWNEGARRLKGYTADEILGQSVERCYTPEDVAAGLPARELATALRAGRSEVETWRVRRDGSRFWGNEIITPLIADDGTHLGFTKITRDMTARKQAEDAMARALAAEQHARTQLEDASRLQDEFLASVSHELRTPLTAMLGFAQLLTTRVHDAAYVARTAARLTDAAKTQAQLIEDLLDVSRSRSGTLRVTLAPLDLVPVVEAAIDTVRPAIDAKGVQLSVALSRSDTTVVGDAQRLQQVVWNIVSNAVKYTPPGGRIDVEVQAMERQVQVLVRDTGQGISAAFLPHVFERFRQQEGRSTRTTGGLGLGLAIVRELVEAHGGTVEVHSAGLGQGTSVCIVVPRAEGAVPPLLAASGTVAGAGAADCPDELAGLRVLIVDDQAEVLALLDETLSACGAEVRAHTTADVALAELRAWQPDVLISDITMPGRDGYWLIEQVRALPERAGGAIPALALTAYVRVEERLRVLHAGFQLFVPKPIEPQELRASVARLLRMERPAPG